MLTTNSIEKEILVGVLSNPGETFYENVLSDFLDEQGIDHDFRKLLHNNPVSELKPYQEKCLDIWANHWINIRLCTRLTDESKAEQYFCDFYNQLGFPIPKNIVWFNNPVEMCDRISNWDQVWYQTWHKVADFILNPLKNQILDRLKNRAVNRIRNYVWDQISNRVWSQAWSQINNQIWNQIKNKVWNAQQDAYWLAFYAYCMQVLRIETPKPIVLFMLLAQEINWWFPAEQTVFATRKPKECIVEDGKLVKLVYQDNHTII
jgi:hypothetical protein